MVFILFAYIYPSVLPEYPRTHSYESTSWALVTGASDEIGFGFAQELCARGFNVVLYDRNPTKLERVRDELQTQFPSSLLRTVVVDASSFTERDICKIVGAVENLPLTLLVNNVGGTGVLDANFETIETHTTVEIDSLLSLNVSFTLWLTNALLPLRKRNDPALILNIGSLADVGTPFLPVYSAIKGALHAWSCALTVEQDTYMTGVKVLEIVVDSMQSQQNQTAKTTFYVPSSREMAKAALERVGCGQKTVPGYFPHYIQRASHALLPETVMDWATVKSLKPLTGRTERAW
ncbi:hypothetical protein MMC13_001289 [Lambiella insularis]|nr:hypothetical protein [Lambiella insularis]